MSDMLRTIHCDLGLKIEVLEETHAQEMTEANHHAKLSRSKQLLAGKMLKLLKMASDVNFVSVFAVEKIFIDSQYHAEFRE